MTQNKKKPGFGTRTKRELDGDPITKNMDFVDETNPFKRFCKLVRYSYNYTFPVIEKPQQKSIKISWWVIGILVLTAIAFSISEFTHPNWFIEMLGYSTEEYQQCWDKCKSLR